MKKILSIIITLSILLSLVTVFAYAESTHWAYDTAQTLYEKGIVSGYQDGSFKLDNTITRAEFARVINKSFNLTSKASSNFPDVNEDKWYYDDMLIAKGNGYITGDESGNANPESDIKRSEAAVIISRILGLDTTSQKSDLTDINEIPDWARGAVVALAKKEIIKGYNDGSFKPDNSLKRGEGFSLVLNLINGMKKPDEEIESPKEEIQTSTNIGNVNASPSYGGGGGSSSGGTVIRPVVPSVAEIPVIVKFDANTVSFKEATGAESYKIRIRLADKECFVETSELSYNVLSDVKELAKDRQNAVEDFYISVMSLGKSNYDDSDYSKEIKAKVTFESIDTPIISARYGIANKIPRAIITWDEITGASTFDVKIVKDGVDVDSQKYQLDLIKREIIIPDTSFASNNTEILVTAISSDPLSYKNSQVASLQLNNNLSAGEKQDGTEQFPWLITSGAEFESIGKDGSKYGMSDVYEIRKDITVTKIVGTSSNPFKGTIKGRKNGTNYKPTITLDISSEGTNTSDGQLFVGMIGYADGAKISNLVMKGKVMRTIGIGNVTKNGLGSVVGYLNNSSTVFDCINYSEVSHTDANDFSMAGGIIGQVNNSTVKNCINLGSVTGKRYVGGIVGRATGVSSIVTGCRNENGASVSGGDYTGGIIGEASLQNSQGFLYNANKGLVKGSSRTGGLVGHLGEHGANIKECFNSGEIITSSANSGAFIGTLDYRCNPTVTDTFNTSNVKKSNGTIVSKGLACFNDKKDSFKINVNRVYTLVPLVIAVPGTNGENAGTVTVSNNDFYYTGEEITDNDILNNIGTFMSDSDMKELLQTDSDFVSQGENAVWTKLDDFDYPQLINNPYNITISKTPSLKNFKYEILSGENDNKNLNFSWTLPENVSKVSVKVNNNSRIEAVTDGYIELSDVLTSYTIDSFVDNSYYEIFVKMEFTDGSEFTDNVEIYVNENVNANDVI